MAAVLLMIGKIVLLALLALLGLLLLLLLSLLFVPVRYQARGLWRERRFLEGGVGWLLHLFWIRGGWEAGVGLWITVRLAGIPVWRLKPEEPEKPKASPDQQREEDGGGERRREHRPAAGEEAAAAEAPKAKGEGAAGAPEEVRSRAAAGDAFGAEPAPGPVSAERADGRTVRKTAERIRRFLRRLISLPRRIRERLNGIKTLGAERAAWLKDERNQASLRLILRQLKKLLAHALPRRGSAQAVIGFEDPYYTGLALEAAAVLYPLCRGRIEVYPVFDRKVLELSGDCKGRIRLWTLLRLLFPLWRDKHTRRLLLGLLR